MKSKALSESDEEPLQTILMTVITILMRTKQSPYKPKSPYTFLVQNNKNNTKIRYHSSFMKNYTEYIILIYLVEFGLYL